MFLRKIAKVALIEATIVGAVYAYKNYGKAIKAVITDFIEEKSKNDTQINPSNESYSESKVVAPEQSEIVAKKPTKKKPTVKNETVKKSSSSVKDNTEKKAPVRVRKAKVTPISSIDESQK